MTNTEALKRFWEKQEPVRLLIPESSNLIAVSGSGDGGRTYFDRTYSTLRQGNPLRMGARIEGLGEDDSDASFSIRTGSNYGTQAAVWGNRLPQSTPTNIDSIFWQQQVRTLACVVPIRTAALGDIENLGPAIIADIIAETATIEGTSMVQNNDQSNTGAYISTAVTAVPTFDVPNNAATIPVTSVTGFTIGNYAWYTGANGAATSNNVQGIITAVGASTVTVQWNAFIPNHTTFSGAVSLNTVSSSVQLGGTDGLRGLSTYGAGTAAYGTSGSATTAGIHTLQGIGGATLSYDVIANMASALPPQYWGSASTMWHVHPTQIANLRKLKDTNGLPIFLDIGDYDAAPVGMMQGFPVIPNSNLPSTGAGSIYLADWYAALTILDRGEIELMQYEQTQPGTVTFFVQKRLVSTIKDPFAIVRYTAV